MKDIKSYELKKGINLHFVKTDKFKTNYIGFSFHRPLTTKEATVNSLLANVLKRGCPQYPDTALLQKRLEQLYGAELNASVKKKGDIQLVSVTFEFANEEYLGSNQSVFEDICNLAEQIVFKQIGFNPSYVKQEKENLKKLILSLINDKREYAQIRLIEEMCKQEPYGIMELGSLERLEGINEDMLFSHYKNILLKSRLDIFIVGNIDEQMVISQMKKITFGLEDNEEQLIQSIIIKEVSDIKKVVQKEQVNQAKLAMGFRTKTQASDADFCALMVCNAVFGGGPYSKLFNNVREKLSLAYYVYSRIDKFKGVMLVNSGIETDNYQIAFDSIMDQMEEVKNGRFSDDEIMAAKLGTINMIRSIGDSQRLMEDYYIGEIICNKKEDIDEFADSIMNINKEQIIEAAQKIQLDTIYFLTSQN